MAQLDRLTQQQLVARILQDWAKDVEQVLKDKLRARHGHVPRDTLDNLRTRVISAAAQDDTSVFMLQFQDSGRHVDMKRLEFRKRPIQRGNNFLLNWVLKKGLEKFKFVPGYQDQSRIGISREKQASRIASAIIAAKGRDLQANRRRRRMGRWYNKTFYSMVEQLVQKVLNEQGEYMKQKTVADIKSAFNS